MSLSRKRKENQLPLKSIWDESSVSQVIANGNSKQLHAIKMWRWLFANLSSGINDIPMSSWCTPKHIEHEIKKSFQYFTTKIVERNESSRGDTTKLVIELQDGHRIETVIMRHADYNTVCVSSQIGCQMGCKFCATGTMGIIGDLTAGEIIEQFIHASMIAKIRNVVFMGMGEPLNNFDNVKLAVQFLIDTKRIGLSPRHVTVSTVGVVKNMYRLSDELPNVSMALSLHAPTQDVRLKIVPAASGHPLDKLMEAVDYHIAKNMKNNSKHNNKKLGGITHVMIEYILIKDVNDLEEHAHLLGQLLLSRRHHILLNLIPYNPTVVAEDFEAPTQDNINKFFRILISDDYKIFTRIRQEMGQDIAGACGQLVVNGQAKNKKSKDVNDIEDLSGRSSSGSSNNKKDKSTKIAVPANTEVIGNNEVSGKSFMSFDIFSMNFLYLTLVSLPILTGAAFMLFNRNRKK
jgi:23S rRNA (adenine(2503)-C(2))-methyltransferase